MTTTDARVASTMPSHRHPSDARPQEDGKPAWPTQYCFDQARRATPRVCAALLASGTSPASRGPNAPIREHEMAQGVRNASGITPPPDLDPAAYA